MSLIVDNRRAIRTDSLNTVTCIFQAWRKYGAAEHDPPGPNPANTIVQVEEINMQITLNKEVNV